MSIQWSFVLRYWYSKYLNSDFYFILLCLQLVWAPVVNGVIVFTLWGGNNRNYIAASVHCMISFWRCTLMKSALTFFGFFPSNTCCKRKHNNTSVINKTDICIPNKENLTTHHTAPMILHIRWRDLLMEFAVVNCIVTQISEICDTTEMMQNADETDDFITIIMLTDTCLA